jgi:hypothetical protein
MAEDGYPVDFLRLALGASLAAAVAALALDRGVGWRRVAALAAAAVLTLVPVLPYLYLVGETSLNGRWLHASRALLGVGLAPLWSGSRAARGALCALGCVWLAAGAINVQAYLEVAARLRALEAGLRQLYAGDDRFGELYVITDDLDNFRGVMQLRNGFGPWVSSILGRRVGGGIVGESAASRALVSPRSLQRRDAAFYERARIASWDAAHRRLEDLTGEYARRAARPRRPKPTAPPG